MTVTVALPPSANESVPVALAIFNLASLSPRIYDFWPRYDLRLCWRSKYDSFSINQALCKPPCTLSFKWENWKCPRDTTGRTVPTLPLMSNFQNNDDDDDLCPVSPPHSILPGSGLRGPVLAEQPYKPYKPPTHRQNHTKQQLGGSQNEMMSM